MNINTFIPKVIPIDKEDYSFFPYLLVVSSDSLYILSPDKKTIVEIIIEGKDNDGYVCASDNEDDFLDAIIDIKRDILAGLNPLRWIV